MCSIQVIQTTRENVLIDAIEILKPVTEKLKEKEKPIGEQLAQAIRKAKLQEREVGACPSCKSGKLVILTSRKTGKRFVGCTNYFQGTCKTAFPLPQRGHLKPTGKTCRGCGWQTVTVATKRKRPWNLCFNPQCPLKEKSNSTPLQAPQKDLTFQADNPYSN